MGQSRNDKKEIYNDTMGYRRTHLNEPSNVEHLHIGLIKQGERIEQLRDDLDNKNRDEVQLRYLSSASKGDLESVDDAHCRPMHRMCRKINKLKESIRGLSEQILCNNDDDSE
jgi:hypothetical protein